MPGAKGRKSPEGTRIGASTVAVGLQFKLAGGITINKKVMPTELTHKG
jgi:hypothetical protein